MKVYLGIVRAVSRITDFVAGISLILIMVLTTTDVVLRYLGHPIIGCYDMVGLGGALILGFALPGTSYEKKHIIVDIFVDRFPGKVRMTFELLTRLMGAFLFFLLGWNLAKLGTSYFRTGQGTLTLGIPLYPIVYAVMTCCFVEVLVIVQEFVAGCCDKEKQ